MQQGGAAFGRPRGAALALYRIAQEAMGNAATNGAARNVNVRLARSNGRVTLSVSDDGSGFEPSRIAIAGTRRCPWVGALIIPLKLFASPVRSETFETRGNVKSEHIYGSRTIPAAKYTPVTLRTRKAISGSFRQTAGNGKRSP